MPDRGSVFAKLVVAMLTMAACLLILVTAFFWFSVGPNLNSLIFRLAEEYSRSVAASSPDREGATKLARRLDLEIRYEGRDGTWATAPGVQSIDSVRSGRIRDSHFLLQPKYYVMPSGRADGQYLFAWTFSERLQAAHAALLILLLVVILAVVLATHAVLRRLLRPLRVLSDGVARLGEGELDVVLRSGSGTHDEFDRLTGAFNTMAGRVREMIRARDQLLVDVSHELRSPLTRMKVALELAPDDEQRRRLAGDVAEMERMVAELLELERLRSGQGLQVARHDVVAIVRDVAAEFEGRPPGVRIDAGPGEVALDVDAGKMRMVMRNLLENAIKYSTPERAPVEVSVTDAGDSVTVRVTDGGVGIPEQEMERVFEPFVRVDASRSKVTGGYGLGLSICKRVMEAHGGRIVIERRGGGGRGTVFVLTLPRRRGEGAT
jgi:signal transduction histidine kinase